MSLRVFRIFLLFHFFGFAINTVKDNDSWTFLVYINDHGDLRQGARTDISQIETAAEKFTKNIRIAIYHDKYSDKDSLNVISNGIKKNIDFKEVGLTRDKFRFFIKWAKDYFSTTKYCLIISSHGNIFKFGSVYDPNNLDDTKALKKFYREYYSREIQFNTSIDGQIKTYINKTSYQTNRLQKRYNNEVTNLVAYSKSINKYLPKNLPINSENDIDSLIMRQSFLNIEDRFRVSNNRKFNKWLKRFDKIKKINESLSLIHVEKEALESQKISIESFDIFKSSKNGIDLSIQALTFAKKEEDYFRANDLQTVLNEEGFKFDIIFLHACSLANAEVLYQLKDACDFLLASQLDTHAGTYDFTKLLSWVDNSFKENSLAVAHKIFNTYQGNSKSGKTLSLFDLSKFSDFENLMLDFNNFLVSSIQEDNNFMSAIKNIRNGVSTYSIADFNSEKDRLAIDLYTYIYRNKTRNASTYRIEVFSDHLNQLSEYLEIGKNQLIMANYSKNKGSLDGDIGSANLGLSLFFPKSILPEQEELKNLDFSIATNWIQFLELYFNH